MTTKAQLGIGTLLQYGDNAASPETFTTLAEALDITVSVAREFLDVTNQDSPNESREYIGGLSDVDEFTVECNLSDGGSGDAEHDPSHDAALAMQEAGGASTWRIWETLTSGANREWRFEAIIGGYSVNFPVAGQKTVSFTFRITGGITRYNQ